GLVTTSVKGHTEQSRTGKKCFNLWTYKIHALGDYVQTTRRLGTTDSYSTQTGEREHRRVKRFYSRTNKRNAIRQVTKRERRETRLLRARRAVEADIRSRELEHKHHVGFSQDDALPFTHPEMHHHMSDSRRYVRDAFSFSRAFPDDSASKDFLPRLKDHLLGRLLGLEYNGDETQFSDADRATVRITNNEINLAKEFRANYTTYDVQHDQDSLNPRNRCDVMVMSPETGPKAHPYCTWSFSGFGGWGFTRTTAMDSPETSADPFGFLDPSLVIRGCHLIPAFHDGRTSELLSPNSSAGRPLGDTDDWRGFYVNWFVDRDIIMRYIGGGGGHAHQNRQAPQEDRMEIDGEASPDDTLEDTAMDIDADEEEEDGGLDEDRSESEDEGEYDGSDEEEDLGPEDGEMEFMDFE
ncbi:hypothetical protein HWV62_39183, partial [Athelia sp. TMB]